MSEFASCYEPELSIAIDACEKWVSQARNSAAVTMCIPSSDGLISAVSAFLDAQPSLTQTPFACPLMTLRNQEVN